MAEELPYKYYVVYDTGKGIGSFFLTRNRPMDTEEEIWAARQYIIDNYTHSETIITFFTQLKG